MPEAPIEALQQAVEGLHGCHAAFLEVVPVHETFQGQTVWQGTVHVFRLRGHPQTDKAYAWSYEKSPGGKREFYAVLGAGPIQSAVDAVRASIVAGLREQEQN